MGPRVRKLALTAHVTSSVGWLGAVVTALVLAVVGLVSADAAVIRAVYLTLDLVGWYVLVPLSMASLLTGLVQALGSTWGLLRHYWVLAKLMLNLFATAVLLLYTQTLDHLAALTRETPSADLLALRNPSPVVHGGGALLILIGAAALSVYKPRGLTRYGWRRQQQHRLAQQP